MRIYLSKNIVLSQFFFLTLLVFLLPAQLLAIIPPKDGKFPEGFLQKLLQDSTQFKYGDPGWIEKFKRRLEFRKKISRGEASLQALWTDNYYMPVLLANFPNESNSFSVQDFQNNLFGDNPTGSITDYFDEVSYNQFHVTGTVYGWFTVDNPNTYYACGSYGRRGTYPQNSRGFFHEVCVKADPVVDFGKFDNDGPDGLPNSGDDDGYVDGVTVVFAGAGGEFSEDSTTDLWTCAAGSFFKTDDNSANGGNIIIRSGNICSELYGKVGEINQISHIGIFVHEFCHNLGLPDLYDYDYSSYGVGDWCTMSSGIWKNEGKRPVHLSAWCKIKLGWITPLEVNGGIISVSQVENYPQVFKILLDSYQSSQYFLVENRQKDGFDSYLPGSGLLIYHVDETQTSMQNETHKLIDVEEADGLDQLDNRTSYGDAGDPYPGTANNRNFNDVSTPNSRDYEGLSTGVGISNISDSGPTMTARIQTEGFVISPEITLSATSISFGDLSVSSTITRTFTIINDGSADLVVSNISSDNGVFTVSPTSVTIAAGQSQTVMVTFNPTTAGIYSATITISNNDSNEATLTVNVSGNATAAPEITLSITSISIKNVRVGSSMTGEFTITNDGTSNLVVSSISSNNNLFTVNPNSATIAPSDSHVVTITFSPTAFVNQSAIITITSNDSDEGTLNISVFGIVESYSLTGVVKLREIGISFVSVFITGEYIDTMLASDLEGVYSLTNLNGGIYTITFQKSGYIFNPTSLEVNISDSDIIVQDIIALIQPPILTDPGQYVKSGTTYTLQWTSNPIAANYTIEESTNINFKDVEQFNTESTSKIFQYDTSTTITYFYRVRTNSTSSDSSAWSNIVDMMVMSVLNPPIVKSSVLNVLSGNEYTILWNDVSGASNYSIQEAIDTTFSETNNIVSTDNNKTFSHTVSTSTVYYYRVMAIDISGNSLKSPWSNIIKVEIIPATPIISVDCTFLNFGSVYIDSTSNRVFSIRNTGTDTLRINSIEVRQSAIFKVNPNSAKISADANQQVTVIFTPISEQSYHDTLTILNSDSTIYIVVDGSGVPVPVFNSSVGNVTFKDTTGYYDMWVKLNDVLIEPVVKMIISEDGGVTFRDTVSCSVDQDRYNVKMPAQPLGTVLNYYYEVVSASGEIKRMPSDAPFKTYILQVSLQKTGDINDDWKVDIFDLLELLKQLGGLVKHTSQGDVNKDNNVDIFDLLELLKLL
ncbi:MAG TPA: M6 family metalloprotease domain-containing protein, partial [Bacteroidales bacterium]|nr:M6 family metalloprotease domain-containing protein [Bacteroidales bacterium]